MWSQGRIALVALASLTLASGCFNPNKFVPLADDDGTATLSDSDTEDSSGGSASISTVTSDTDATTTDDPATTGSGGSSTSEATTTAGETDTGVDLPPSIVSITFNKTTMPGTVVHAGKQTIVAVVHDDHQIDRVEFFIDDQGAPFATVAADPKGTPTDQGFEILLPIYDAEFNGPHSIRAVAYDSVELSAEGVVDFKVELPLGGTNVWQVGAESKWASKAVGVAVDSFGDVVAVGWQAVSPDLTRTRMVVRKYSGGDGELLWERFVPSQFEDPAPEGNNVARGVAVDEYDNIYVVGDLDPGAKPSLWVGKYTIDGIKIDEHVSVAPASRGHAIAVDESRIYVAGYYSKADLNPIGTLSAFDPELGPIWSDTLEGVAPSGTALFGVTIGPDGDIIVAGTWRLDQIRRQGLVARYKPTGSRTWWRTAVPKDLTNPIEESYSVAVDEDGHFVSVGRRKVDGDPRRFWIFRVDGKGDEVSSDIDEFGRCGGLNEEKDDFCGIAVSPSGHELLAGVAPNDGMDDDFLVEKIKGKSLVWSATYDGYDGDDDRSLAITVDDDGYVFAVGYEHHSGAPRWWVTKYNP